MEMIRLSPSGAFQMPAELRDDELAALPDKGVPGHRYLRLGRQNGESLNVYAAPRIPPGWQQLRLIQMDSVLYIEFRRTDRQEAYPPPSVGGARNPVLPPEFGRTYQQQPPPPERRKVRRRSIMPNKEA